MPTSSPARFRTGLPEFPPMVSAVDTKLNGVFKSSLSLPSSQRLGKSKGSRKPCFFGPFIHAGKRGHIANRLLADLVALHLPESQPQREGGIGRNAGAVFVKKCSGNAGICLLLDFRQLFEALAK